MKPAYLLLGPETGQKSQYLKQLREMLFKELGESPELYRFYPFETENGEILQVLQNLPLFSSHNLVILSQVDDLNAAQVSMIADYLEKPSSFATLILISAETRINKKIQSMIPKSETKIFWEMFEDKKHEWLVKYFLNHKLQVEDTAVNLILELVENNTYDLRAACGQLAVYLLGNTEKAAEPQDERDFYEITVKDIEQFIYHSRRENVFSLFAALADCDLERTLDIYRTLFFAGEGDPTALFSGLLWQFRRLLSYVSLTDEGTTEANALQLVSVMGKPARITGRKTQQIYRDGASNYNAADIAAVIMKISDYEVLIRDSGSSLQRILMEKFLYECIIQKGRSVASLLDYCASYTRP